MHTIRLATILTLAAGLAQAAEPHAAMTGYVDTQVRGWFADPAIQAAIAASNAAHAGLTEAETIALDDLWRAEIGSGSEPTITPVLTSAASDLLRAHLDLSGGAVTEIILNDSRIYSFIR